MGGTLRNVSTTADPQTISTLSDADVVSDEGLLLVGVTTGAETPTQESSNCTRGLRTQCSRPCVEDHPPPMLPRLLALSCVAIAGDATRSIKVMNRSLIECLSAYMKTNSDRNSQSIFQKIRMSRSSSAFNIGRPCLSYGFGSAFHELEKLFLGD